MWCFLLFYGFICDFLEILSVKSSKIFTESRILLDMNFKHEKKWGFKGRYFDFWKFMSFTAAKKLVLDFPEEQAPTLVKYLLPVCQIL